MTRPPIVAGPSSSPGADAVFVEGLAAARLRAATDFPYYAHGLFALTPVVQRGLGTLAVDRAWRLYVDPAAVATWNVRELSAVLVHELHHLLRDHAGRADALDVARHQRPTWNVAADCAINDDLLAASMALPGRPPTPAHLGLRDGELEETYFEALRSRPYPPPSAGFRCGKSPRDRVAEGEDVPESARSGERDGEGPIAVEAGQRPPPGCGSGADGITRPWEVDDDETPGLTATEADLVRRQVAAEVLAHVRTRGSLPQGLVRWAEARLRPRLDWRQILRSEFRAARTWSVGNTHTTYRRPDRRAESRPGFVFPGTHRPAPGIAVVIDTSASMAPDDLGQALAEVQGLLTESATHELWMLSCDSEAYRPERVSRIGQVELVGGGGTDLRVGVECAAALRPRPELIFVVTDGDTPWPAAAPRGTRVVAVIMAAEDRQPTGAGIASVWIPSGDAAGA